MKKLIFSVCFATFALSIFAQGTIVFGNNIPGSVVAHIFGPDPSNPSFANQGLTTFDVPAGTDAFNGAPLGTQPSDFIGTFTAQLWGGATLNSLAPVPGADAPIVTQGLFATSGSPVVVPGVPTGQSAFLQLRVWDNRGGTVTSWGQAYAAALVSGELVGESYLFRSQPLGSGITAPNMVGLVSFNIHTIPEPSTLALIGSGTAALFIFQRRRPKLLARGLGRTATQRTNPETLIYRPGNRAESALETILIAGTGHCQPTRQKRQKAIARLIAKLSVFTAS